MNKPVTNENESMLLHHMEIKKILNTTFYFNIIVNVAVNL